ncbi:Transcription initiation factor IIA large subunit [Fusarium oxysporum f. sp. cubense race 1]|uniref:Transcription initiation factor IIA large subunit n=1 Tax=Fusarium oxysporum f. sp. cubense (strain race 1) TaxID=1229664 RepID=N4TDU3_FUSC1|nr:Transcription initiation factor IIA large subunit [Fusarium oxysporum f. sp. cubense race 1]
MSNPAVGNVYQAIIDEVVNSSRVDFEESGVEESVLEELRQGWQQKLTQLHVAQFPWDPKPDPPAQAPPSAVPPAQTHAQAQFSPQLSNPTGLSLPGMAQPQVQNGIKPEGNNIKTEPHPHIQNGQTDGAGDLEEFEGVLMQRAADGNLHELGRVEIDRMLHEQILAKAKSMEGGGLMLPLKEATRTSSVPTSRVAKGKQPAAYDGGDDDDEDDDDAINSDLDDPEEDRDDDDVDDEGLGNIMLCMYDKVQRVKNKWKCTLKDGVLTVNGKEYVFHKATGEYEW